MSESDGKQISPFPESVENNKYPGPIAAGIFFSITTVLLTYGGRFLAFKNDYLRSGLGEVLFILLPVLIFLILGKYNVKDTLKLRKTKPINYLIIVFLMIFGMPIVGVLNAVVLGIIRLIFGKNLPIPQISIPDAPTLFIAILVIGASAAICEEILFRGLISKGYRRLGVIGSLVITSILFGVLHRDIQKGVATILLGALIGFIVYRTKSIYSGMVAHFTNNTVAVLLTFGAEKMTEKLSKMGIEQAQSIDDVFSSIPTASLVIVIIFYAILFLGFLAAFIALLYAFIKSTDKQIQIDTINMKLSAEADVMMREEDKASRFSLAALLCVLPGLILILLTFVDQVLMLMDVNSGIIYTTLKTLGI